MANDKTFNTDYSHEELQRVYYAYHQTEPILAEVVAELMVEQVAQWGDVEDIYTIARQLPGTCPDTADQDVRRILYTAQALADKADDLTRRELIVRTRYESIKRLERIVNKALDDHGYLVISDTEAPTFDFDPTDYVAVKDTRNGAEISFERYDADSETVWKHLNPYMELWVYPVIGNTAELVRWGGSRWYIAQEKTIPYRRNPLPLGGSEETVKIGDEWKIKPDDFVLIGDDSEPITGADLEMCLPDTQGKTITISRAGIDDQAYAVEYRDGKLIIVDTMN